MQISKQLVARLYALSDEHLMQFFRDNAESLEFPLDDYADVISDVMTNMIPDYENNIRPLYSNLKKNRHSKRRRWVDAVQKKLCDDTIPVSHVKHPFHYLYIQESILSPAQFKQLYGTTSTDEITTQVLADIADWASNAKFLIDFPILLETRRKDAYPSFREDIFYNCLEILIKNYDGRINQFLKQRPEILIDAPLFTPSPFSIQLMTGADGKTSAEITTAPGKLTISVDGKNYDNSVRVFDSYDESILSALISCVSSDFYKTKAVLVGPNELARAIANHDTIEQGKQVVGGKTYSNLAQRIKRMASVTYYYETEKSDSGETIEKRESVFHLIDSFDRIETRDGKVMFRVVFSDRLSDSIIQQQTISVTRESFDKLESPCARLLYPVLQRERINLSRQHHVVGDGDERLISQYNHYFFSHVILFNPRKHKATSQAMASVFDALKEFKEKGIAISDFKPIGNTKVEIIYFPLTEAEKYDFNVVDPEVLLEDLQIID